MPYKHPTFGCLPWAVLDFEMGGQPGDRIIEIGLVRRTSGGHVDFELNTLVNPGHALRGYPCKIHGLRTRHVELAPHFSQVVDVLVEATRGCVVVGHSIKNDIRALNQELVRLKREPMMFSTVDTQRLADAVKLDGPRNLAGICETLGITLEPADAPHKTSKRKAHGAMSDARATLSVAELLHEMLTPGIHPRVIHPDTMTPASCLSVPDSAITRFEAFAAVAVA